MIHTRSCVLFALLAFAACSGKDTADFGAPRQLPKDQRPTVWDAAARERLGLPDMSKPKPDGAAAPQGQAAPKGELRWVGALPTGWETQPSNPARFRDAVWKITSDANCEIYLTAAVGGGVAGNLARWYTQQFGIAEVPAMEALPIVELAGKPARLAEMKGTFAGKANWAALIAFVPQGEQMMTFKFTGPEAVVMANKDAFLALAKSLRQATASPDAKAPPIDPNQPMPSNHPDIGAANGGAANGATATPAAATGPFTGTAPAGWTPKPGTQRFLHHTFGKDGEAYVGQLGGTVKQNLDIWRGEMGQQPMTDAEYAALPKAAFLGEDSVLLDLAGNFQSMSGKKIDGARMLVMARSDGQSTQFAKLFGAAADVAAQVDAFRSFCASVRRAQ